MHIHQQYCSPEVEEEEVKLTTVPQTYQIEDRELQLQKFELLLLNKNQVIEFEKLLQEKKHENVSEPMFRSDKSTMI